VQTGVVSKLYSKCPLPGKEDLRPLESVDQSVPLLSQKTIFGNLGMEDKSQV